MPTNKDLERQVIAERQVEERRQIAEEVSRRVAQLESARIQREWKEEAARRETP